MAHIGRRMRTAIHKFLADQIPDLREKLREMFNEQDYEANQLDFEGNNYLHHVLRIDAHQQDDSVTVPLIYLLGNVGIDPTLTNDNGDSALHMAVQHRCTPTVISALLKIGADPLQPNAKGETAVKLAMRSDDDVYLALFTHRPGLFQAAKNRDFRKIDYLMGCFFKADPVRLGVKLSEVIGEDPDVQFAISNYDARSQFFHHCLAGDIATAREYYYRMKDCKIEDLVDQMFVDDKGTLPMSLIGYAMLLNLPDVANYLVEIGADVNRKISIDVGLKVPLFWYCMANSKKIEYGSAFSSILHKADIASMRRDAASVLYLAWERKWPLDVVQPFAKTKAFISRRNQYGHTARDLILIKAVSKRMVTWREELYFIDRHVRDMFEEFDYPKIEELVLSGYEQIPRLPINLPDFGAKPTPIEAVKLENAKKLKQLMDNFSELKRCARTMFASIETGNMPDFREALNSMSVQMTDKAGRTMLHLAVIFDRRVLAKFLIDRYPDLVTKKDIFGRTPLHYAAALEGSVDLEEALKQKGANFQDVDYFDRRPIEYDNEDGLAMLEDERGKLYGADAYCLEMYVRFEEAIRKNNFDLVTKLRGELNEVPIEVITRDMYSPPQYVPPREVVFIAVDEDREKIAEWLVRNGAAWDITSFLVTRRTPKPINLYTAASLKNMEGLKKLIMQKETEFKSQKAADHARAEEERLKDVERQMKYEEKMIREGMIEDDIAEDLNEDAPDGWDEEDGKKGPGDPHAMEEGHVVMQQGYQQYLHNNNQPSGGAPNNGHEGTRGCSVM